MLDRLFSALLTFTVLVGGSLAIGAELLDLPPTAAAASAARASAPVVVQLERVVVTGRKTPARTDLAQAGTTSPRAE